MAKQPKHIKPKRFETAVNALRNFLTTKSANTQEAICQALEQQGYEVNQSKISRMLRKIGAVKVKNERGEISYWLPKEPPPPEISTPVSHLILDITHNETLIIVHTSPGAASLIARLLDYKPQETEILGTLAGDNMIFVAPKSIKKIDQTIKEIKEILAY